MNEGCRMRSTAGLEFELDSEHTVVRVSCQASVPLGGATFVGQPIGEVLAANSIEHGESGIGLLIKQWPCRFTAERANGYLKVNVKVDGPESLNRLGGCFASQARATEIIECVTGQPLSFIYGVFSGDADLAGSDENTSVLIAQQLIHLRFREPMTVVTRVGRDLALCIPYMDNAEIDERLSCFKVDCREYLNASIAWQFGVMSARPPFQLASIFDECRHFATQGGTFVQSAEESFRAAA